MQENIFEEVQIVGLAELKAHSKNIDNVKRNLIKKLKARHHSEHLGIDGIIILKWMAKIGCILSSSDLGHGTVEFSCENSNETARSMSDG
jgi:uncharacterized protein Yka (UPF0111/DUF47 family)